MNPIIVSKSQFKPKALAYLRQVEERKQSVIITHFRKPVATITPFTDKDDGLLASLRGTVRRYDDPTEPVGLEDWEAFK